MPESLEQQPIKLISAKRVAKRVEILNAAASQMNERGATSVSLSGVAKSVGLSRNALYYYFSDRLDLICACYERASEVMALALEATIQAESSAAQRLNFFVEQMLLIDTQEQAILSDLGILPEPQRAEIHALHKKNLSTLESIIQQGIDSGELWSVNPAIASQVLLGILNWTQLWQKWNGVNKSAAAAITDVFQGGISTDRDYQFECQVNVQTLRARRINFFDPVCINEEKQLQLLGVASLLFNQKGIDSTSFEDIAEHIGVTKGSIYHYFKDKRSLLTACYEHAFEQYELFAQVGEDSKQNGLHRIMIALHLNCQAQASINPPLIMQNGVSSLSESHQDRARHLADKFQAIRLEALKDGSYREGDKSIIELFAGAFFWVQRWMIENPSTPNLHLADVICQIISRGIVR